MRSNIFIAKVAKPIKSMLSAEAKEFIPLRVNEKIKSKKTKDERACPRKRKKLKKNRNDRKDRIVDRQVSDLVNFAPITSTSKSDNGNSLQHQIDWTVWLNDFVSGSGSGLTSATSHLINIHRSIDRSSPVQIETNDFLQEQRERKKWTLWAIKAAENERNRRIQILHEIDEEQKKERLIRCEWAKNAIEYERYDRISQQFLLSMTSTNWFNETISTYSEDYELVCPYVRFGCGVTCNRSTISQHLRNCQFAISIDKMAFTTYPEVGLSEEVVCPNTILGCQYVGTRNEILYHMHNCSFNGMTREQELAERIQLKRFVILECEEERSRRIERAYNSRVLINNSEDNVRPISFVHTSLKSQISTIKQKLQVSLVNFHRKSVMERDSRTLACTLFLEKFKEIVLRLWPFSTLETYGSFVTGLYNLNSDIDIVICFSDEFQSFVMGNDILTLIHMLADYISREASDLMTINTVLLNAKIPVIKAVVKLDPCDSFNNIQHIPIDISIDSAVHTGLASTEFIRTIFTALPPLVPIVNTLKEYLRSKDLCDPYLGGISSYALALLSIFPFLRKLPSDHMKVLSSTSNEFNFPVMNAELDPKYGSRKHHLTDRNSESHNIVSIDCNTDSLQHSTRVTNQLRNQDRLALDNKFTRLNRFYNSSTKFRSHVLSSPLIISNLTWSKTLSQKNYGRNIALEILGFDNNHDEYNDIATDVPCLIEYSDDLLGSMLINILNEFGENFSLGICGFSVRHGGCKFELTSSNGKSPNHPQINDPIVIEDPVDIYNNVGRNCYKVVAIQKAFMDASDKLKNFAVRVNNRSFSKVTEESEDKHNAPIYHYEDIQNRDSLVPLTEDIDNIMKEVFHIKF